MVQGIRYEAAQPVNPVILDTAANLCVNAVAVS